MVFHLVWSGQVRIRGFDYDCYDCYDCYDYYDYDYCDYDYCDYDYYDYDYYDFALNAFLMRTRAQTFLRNRQNENAS